MKEEEGQEHKESKPESTGPVVEVVNGSSASKNEEELEQEKEAPKSQPKNRKKLWWWLGGIVAVLASLTILSWQLGWFQNFLNHYNAASMTFRVREDDTYALEGVIITYRGADLVTDSSGQAQVPSTIAGTYPVTATKPGYITFSGDIAVRRGDNGIVSISLKRTPEKLFTVKGLVTDYVTGLALADVQVSISGNTAKSDAAGGFIINKLTTGEYKAVLTHTGFTTKEQTLTIGTANEASLTTKLVPSGHVLFVSNRDNGKRALYTADYAGGNQAQFITPITGTEDYGPITSPDGKYIIFSSTRDKIPNNYGSGYLARLYIVGSDGKKLAKISDDVSAATVRWTNNSRFIYYEAYQDSKLTAYVRRFYDTTKAKTFELGQSEVYTVALSSTGGYALSAVPILTDGAYLVNIVILDLATGATRVLQGGIDGYSASTGITFSADDKLVYYQAQATGDTMKRYELSFDNGNPKEVSLNNDPQRAYFIAPDAIRKAFVDTRDGKRDLFMVDANNANETRLTTMGVVSDTSPVAWGSSSNYLTFAVTREGENAWYIVSSTGGVVQKIVDFTPDSDSVPYY